MREFNNLYDETYKLLNKNIEEIYEFCTKVNMIEYLSYSTVLSWIGFDTSKGYQYMSPLEFEYMIGVFLSIKYDNSKKGKGTIQENGEILKKLQELIPTWKLSNSMRKIRGKDNEEDTIKSLFEANLISITGTMRGYSFYDPSLKIIKDIIKPFKEYFIDSFGINIENIEKYEKTINEYYIKKMNVLKAELRDIIESNSMYVDNYIGLDLFNAMHNYEYNDFLFFTVEDIEKINNDIDKCAFEKFLDSFSIILGDTKNNEYKFPNDKNIFKDYPVIKNENKYFIINFQLIYWCLREKFENTIKNRNNIWNKYNKHKSNYLENATLEIFKKIFPKAQVYKELYYCSMDGKRCELDGLFKYDNCIILIEAKSGIFSRSAQNGGQKRLQKVIYENIEKAAYQAGRAKEYIIQTSKPVFENKYKKVILELDKNGFENIFLINVTMDYFAELSVNLRQLREIGYYDIHHFPWAVSLSDLAVISEFIQFPNQLLHYIYFREKFSNKVLIGNHFKHINELDLFGFYLFEEKEELDHFFIDDINENTVAYNLYCNKKLPIESVIPDFSPIFNEYYNNIRNNIAAELPKKRYNNVFYDMVRQLEKYSDQGSGYTNFIIKLLDLNNEKQQSICNHILKMVDETIKKGIIKINSIPYMNGNFDDKATYGITIATGYSINKIEICDMVKATCIINRYQYNYTEWLGLCCFVDDSRHLINQFILVREEENADLSLTKILKSIPKNKVKIGRNEKCPCGSGKKFKRCCGK